MLKPLPALRQDVVNSGPGNTFCGLLLTLYQEATLSPALPSGSPRGCCGQDLLRAQPSPRGQLCRGPESASAFPGCVTLGQSPTPLGFGFLTRKMDILITLTVCYRARVQSMETTINVIYSSANKLKAFQYKSTTSVHFCYQNIANKADELLATAVGLVSNFHSRPFHRIWRDKAGEGVQRGMVGGGVVKKMSITILCGLA